MNRLINAQLQVDRERASLYAQRVLADFQGQPVDSRLVVRNVTDDEVSKFAHYCFERRIFLTDRGKGVIGTKDIVGFADNE